VTSPKGKSNCCRLSEVSDVLISMTNLVLSGCLLCVEG
jgi:hypothetical protein